MGLEFKTAKKRASDRAKPITFTLDGDEYTFTPPKAAVLAISAISGDDDPTEQIKGMFDWLGNGMAQDQQDRLLARLRDPDDDLDLEDLSNVFQGLVEAAYGRPTT